MVLIDFKERFYYIKIQEENYKTAFEEMVNEWNSMIMGFKNLLQIMRRVMNRILGEYRDRGVEVYINDIVIHDKIINEHDEKLK
jgi:hypothetical protein